MNPEKTTESQRIIAQNHASHKRHYAKGVALILAAVAAGVVIGVGGSILYFKKYYHRVPPKPEAIAQSIIGHMHDILGLKPDEEAKIRTIVDKHMTTVNSIRKNMFEESHKVFDEMNAEIEGVIGPERYKIWDEFKKKRWDSKKYGRRGDRHKDGHPGGKDKGL